MCGELLGLAGRDGRHDGSSPRVRGTHGDAEDRALAPRFIPACAGNSSAPSSPRNSPAVHPRVCGELVQTASGTPRSGGSSPRVRGTPLPRLLDQPALQVHPRVCGELGGQRQFVAVADGSSPRVRGTPAAAGRRGGRPRFIPACAGNSWSTASSTRSAAVHPRVCGELHVAPALDPLLAGSSPRVRGTPRFLPRERQQRRFIPACAGNSGLNQVIDWLNTVHPRVCGELSGGARAARPGDGSSPRVRGTRCRLP